MLVCIAGAVVFALSLRAQHHARTTSTTATTIDDERDSTAASASDRAQRGDADGVHRAARSDERAAPHAVPATTHAQTQTHVTAPTATVATTATVTATATATTTSHDVSGALRDRK